MNQGGWNGRSSAGTPTARELEEHTVRLERSKVQQRAVSAVSTAWPPPPPPPRRREWKDNKVPDSSMADRGATPKARPVSPPLSVIELFPDGSMRMASPPSSEPRGEQRDGDPNLAAALASIVELESQTHSPPRSSRANSVVQHENARLRAALRAQQERVAQLEVLFEFARSGKGRESFYTGRGPSAVAAAAEAEQDDDIETVGSPESVSAPRLEPLESPSAVLSSEDLRREVAVDDILIPLVPLPSRDPSSLPYLSMRSALSPEERHSAVPPAPPQETEGDEPPPVPKTKDKDKEGAEAEGKGVKFEVPGEGRTTPPAPLSSEVEIERIMDQVYELIDTNNDGDISLEEVKGFVGCISKPPTDERLKQLFKECDKDGSGSIERDEFLGLLRILEGEVGIPVKDMVDHFRDACLRKLFDMLDEDKGGTLSFNESLKLVTTLQQECTQLYELRKLKIKISYSTDDIRSIFKSVDDDGSGALDRDEFVSFVGKVTKDIPISHVATAFTKGRKAAQERMRAKRMWFA